MIRNFKRPSLFHECSILHLRNGKIHGTTHECKPCPAFDVVGRARGLRRLHVELVPAALADLLGEAAPPSASKLQGTLAAGLAFQMFRFPNSKCPKLDFKIQIYKCPGLWGTILKFSNFFCKMFLYIVEKLLEDLRDTDKMWSNLREEYQILICFWRNREKNTFLIEQKWMNVPDLYF